MGYAQRRPRRMEQDPDGSVHAEGAGSEDLGRIIAEAHRQQIEKLERRRAQERIAGQRRRTRLASRSLFYLFPALVLVTLINVWTTQHSKTPFTPHEEWVAARSLIYLTASAVEAYREREGRLPAELAQIQQEDDQISYRVIDNVYSLTIQTTTQTVTYREGEDLDPYREDWVELCRGATP